MLRVETALCSAGRSCTVNTEPQPDHTTFFFYPSKTGSVWPAAVELGLQRTTILDS